MTNLAGFAPLDREALFAALFTRLSTAAGFTLFSRKMVDFDACVQGEQPALYLVKGDEQIVDPNPKLPTKWKLAAEVYIFCLNLADPNAGPSIQLNELITAVEGVLIRQPSEGFVPGQPFAQTNDWWTSLNGLCSHCWISGPIIVGEGAAGDQAVAVIPLEILVTPSA